MNDDDEEFFEDEEPEDVWDDGDSFVGTAVTVESYKGVAFRIDAVSLPFPAERVQAHMIGDDRTFEFDRDEVVVLEREAFCGECGQIGCTHDGLDRDG